MSPTTLKLDVLPDDILYDVLCRLSVRNILSWRRVSRKFYNLTHHRPIWANAYTKYPILLPPGPFSYQSAADLEQALKKSHRLEANWTSRSPCPVSRRTFVDTSVVPWRPELSRMKLVLGRYLLMAGRPMLKCFDLESKNEKFTAIAVYDCVATIFDCIVEKDSVVNSTDCQLLCALINQIGLNERIAAVTLLRLCISRGSAKFEHVKEVRLPGHPIYQDVRFFGNILAMASVSHGPMLLHIPTYRVYDVPPCDFGHVGTSRGSRSEYNVTSNHLLCHSFLGFENILEVFPLPLGAAQPNDDDETPSVHILTRSHKFSHPHCLTHHMLLTERHELHNGNIHSARYTFIAQRRPAAREKGRLGLFDISLESDMVTTTWTDAAEFRDESKHGETLLFAGSARAGVSRLVVLNQRREAMAFTISEDGDGKRVIRGNSIVDKGQKKLEMWTGLAAFDGVQGRMLRMCYTVKPAQLEVISFV